MKTKNMLSVLKNIEMPEDIRNRITNNCYTEMENIHMNTNKKIKFFRKPLSAIATLALCFCLAGLTAMAATGKLEGFFKNIIGKGGAIVGTEYHQADNEISIDAEYIHDGLTVDIVIANPNAVPYSEIDLIGIESYKVCDTEGNTVAEGNTLQMTEIIGGKAGTELLLDSIPHGTYKLYVSKFTGSAKGDRPLGIHGNWECEFTVH